MVGLVVTYFVATWLSKKGEVIKESDINETEAAMTSTKEKPSFGKAMVAPIVAIVMLSISPIGNILHIAALKSFQIDLMIILPLAGLIGLIAMGQ